MRGGTLYKGRMKSETQLTWDEQDAPYSQRFADRYFSQHDGREEVRAVFLAGNGLPQRWQDRDHFQIAELGFGTGLSFLETLSQWRVQAPETARLTCTSFELYPLSRDEMARALSPWPDLARETALLLDQWPPVPGRALSFGTVRLELIPGDARETLPSWQGRADAWYLDGFSPARNPQLWERELMQQVFEHTAPGGRFSTYTAAGFVRRNLQDVGFRVQRVRGFGGKRERLQGQKPVCNADGIS